MKINKLLDRLVETDSGCWEFVGGTTPDGYGLIKVNGFDVSRGTIRNVKSGKAWGWLQ